MTFDTLRRRGTGASTRSAKEGKEKGPFQEHFSCYEGLTWQALKSYLESKWPGIRLVERRVRVALEDDGETIDTDVCAGNGSVVVRDT